MVFVAADRCRTQLENLTALLISAFPGSTVYQHMDLFHVPRDVLNNRVDAVFLEAETEKTDDLSLVQILLRQKPGLPVFVTSKTEQHRQKAAEAGASGYFVLPDGEQQLVDAIRLTKNREDML